MRPDFEDFDDEIRGHIALSVKERIERGEDPEAARFAALREFGNVTLTRESMQAVWRPRWLETAGALWQDLRVALRSLKRARGLAVTVAVTLALGIGANAAIFSVVRQVLLRPLVNRDEDRLVYIRQRAPGLGAENTTFSMPEIADIRSRVTTIGTFGEFRRLRDRPCGRQLFRERATSRRPVRAWCGGSADGCRCHRVADAGGARLARGRRACTPA